MIRPAAVAGRFYPSDPAELNRQVDAYLRGDRTAAAKTRALGCVVPHAGYMYSGHVAGAVYAALEMPARCILLGPRHYPQGQPLAILSSGSFETPLGRASIDEQLAGALARACPLLREDAVAHAREHSLEVQIPFLQRIAGASLRFAPIVLATDRYGVMEDLGQAIVEVVGAQSEPVLVIASSDMNHYESDDVTRVKDQRAIAPILELNPRALYDTVRNEGITMCGYAAMVATLVAMQGLGAKSATLVRYATSGDVSGDRDQVVGYAGIVIQ